MLEAKSRYVVPIGTVIDIQNPAALGPAIRSTRKALGLRLEDVALAAGVGIRFLSELERGKETARLSETFLVLRALGIRVSVTVPDDA